MQYLRSQVDDPEIRHLKNINNQRLRSAFEDIIQKYAKDFSKLGDEIDLDTGEIVVNNGHIERMRNEQDTGDRRRSLLGNWINQVHVPGGTSTTHGRSTMNRQPTSYHSMEDGEWEDIDDQPSATRPQTYSPGGQNNASHRTERRESQEALDDLVSSEDDDVVPMMNGGTPRSFGLQHSGYSDQQPSRPDDAPPNPNRANSRPYMPRSFAAGPGNGPAIDREMVRDFAQDIANQITEFLYYFAGSIQQNASNTSNQSFNTYSSPRAQAPHFVDDNSTYSTRPPKRRRTIDENEEYGNSPNMHSAAHPGPIPSQARDKGPINRVAALRSETGASPLRSKHGHRGLTPGMPSLWSGEEDSDYAPQKRNRRKQTSKPRQTESSKAKAKPQAGSGLRNEVRNTSEPPTSSHDKIRDLMKAASSPATKKSMTSANKPPNRRHGAVNGKDREMDGNNDLDLLLIGDEEPLTIRDSEDEPEPEAQNDFDSRAAYGYELEADLEPKSEAADRPESQSEPEPGPEEEQPIGTLDEEEVSENESSFSDKNVKRHYHPRIEFTEEDDRLIEELRNGGMTWPQIAEYVPHTENQIYYRWKRYISKGNKQQRYRRLSGKALDFKLRNRASEVDPSNNPHESHHRGNSEEYEPSEEDVGGNSFAPSRLGKDARDNHSRNARIDNHDEAVAEPSGISLLSLLKVTPTAITSGFRSDQSQRRPMKIVQSVPESQYRTMTGKKFNNYRPPKSSEPQGDNWNVENFDNSIT